jgi:hypothetical protein
MKTKNLITTVVLGLFFLLIFLSPAALLPAENNNIKPVLKIPAQDHIQILHMKDGSDIIGRIVEIGETEIKFKADIGMITIPIEKIEEIEEVPASSFKKGKYWFPHPNPTRLYFAPTGRMLKKGEGIFSDIYLFFPGVAFGVTDNINIGGGVSIFPGVSMKDQLYYFTPKIGFNTSGKSNLAIGALLVATPELFDEDSQVVGVLYGVGTWGSPDSSFSIGLGYGFVGSELASKPMMMLGGEIRMSRRLCFVTENWIFPGIDQPIISYGIRFLGNKFSVDLAFYNVIGEDTLLPGFPYLSFVYQL